jgi:hypothetical protein
MFVVAVHRTPSLTRERYEEVVRRLTNGKSRFESPTDLPFDGLIVHVTGESSEGFCVVDVFDSQVRNARPSVVSRKDRYRTDALEILAAIERPAR